ncbi:MAG: caspase family protein [Rhizobiaceae bacterium]
MVREVKAATQWRSGFTGTLVLAALLLLQTCVMVLAGESRSAVVIGNSTYSFAPLANPGNDASDVAKALESAEFDVELVLDADKDTMLGAVERLGEKLRRNGGVGLFFFAGHGVQVSGENYLVALSDDIADASELPDKALSASEIVSILSQAGNELNIIILDACRDNPLTGGTSGLSRIESSSSLFVSYSTSPGAVALDGAGRNSPYSRNLTLSLTTPGLNLEETFKRTLKGVYQDTAGKQTPWLSSSFFGDFTFRPDGKSVTSQSETSAALQVGGAARQASGAGKDNALSVRRELGGVYRVSGRNPDGSPYKGLLALQERDGFHEFTWWIGKQVFKGHGELAGRMMVVDWNSTHPVVYTFKPNGVLDGEWADGSATDRLERFASAEPDGVPVNGTYSVKGRNPDGSPYSGKLAVKGDGTNYDLKWSISGSSYRGRGILDRGILTVDWGSTQPIVYAVAADGSLHGLWESGKGSEVSTPR